MYEYYFDYTISHVLIEKERTIWKKEFALDI